MAFAYFLAHAPRGFYPLLNGGELAIVYCFNLAAAGAGPFSLDHLWAGRAQPRASAAQAKAQ
jgi:putative oxidoreductase